MDRGNLVKIASVADTFSNLKHGISVLFFIPEPLNASGGIATFYSANVDNICFRSSLIDANPFSFASTHRRHGLSGLPPSLSHLIEVARNAFSRRFETEVDVIETCDWPLGFLPAVFGQSMPYIVQCHGSMGQIAAHDPQQGAELQEAFVQLIEPQLLRYAHRVQTYSLANKCFWEAATGRPVEMIRPAFALPPLPQDVEIDGVGRVFGRLQRWKGPHILCEALGHLGTRSPQIHWHGGVKPWASGDWPADRRLAADFPDVWNVSFHHRDAMSRDRVFALQASALFNVVPSTWDVFNFTAVESMAAARPTIVSTGAGASELIVDGENGFTFENGNSAALADVIERVVSMPEARRREIGNAGRETIQIELDPTRIAQQRLVAYREAIDSFHASPPPKPHEWLQRLLTPEPGANGNFNALLDPVPLRAMGKHMARRIASKLRTRI